MIVELLGLLLVVLVIHDLAVYGRRRRRVKVRLIRATCPDYPGGYGLTKQGEDDGRVRS